MQPRSDYLSDVFNDWLDRYPVPRHFGDKPEAAQKEADALLSIIARHAPLTDYADWLDGVLRKLTEGMTARTWPTGGQVAKACKEEARLSVSKPQSEGEEWTPDPAGINAKKMQRGEAVAECWLYGIMACEMIARGLIDRDTMTRYRSAAFFARKELYSEEKARQWEEEALMAHERGKEAWRNRNEPTSHRPVISLHMRKFPEAPEHVAF